MVRQLEYFIAVEKFRNFRKAAEHCCVEQSTLSLQVKKLEDQLNIQLFDRTELPIKITKSGKKVLCLARKIVDNIKSLRKLASKMSD